MYEQMWNNITRHIGVTWQSIAALVAAFALLGLDEKRVWIPTDFVATLVLLASLWQLAHVLDASHWFNRNLVIIANIERQFLSKEDLRLIHPHFKKHREANEMITHFRLHGVFGIAVAVIVLLYHLHSRVLPSLDSQTSFDWVKMLPYVLGSAGAYVLLKLRHVLRKRYEELCAESPGLDMDATSSTVGQSATPSSDPGTPSSLG